MNEIRLLFIKKKKEKENALISKLMVNERNGKKKNLSLVFSGTL